MKWGHVTPVERNGKIVAAKVIIYPGEGEEYFPFITYEAYNELAKWMEFRQQSGEQKQLISGSCETCLTQKLEGDEEV